MHRDVERILFTAEDIESGVKRIGKKITEDYKGKDLVVIGVLKGAVLFFSDVVREIDLDCEMDFIGASSYHNAAVSTGVVTITKDINVDVAGKDVLIIEDIIDTGRTLSYLKDAVFVKRGAKSVEFCTFIDKPERREVSIDIKYKCFDTPNEFVVGYGLDYAEKYRNLPYIGVLKREIYM